jgi:signal transduction histidine kinase/HAMP domain-containing protein
MSLRARQVAGVTLVVGFAVVAMGAIHLLWITRFSLEESAARGELLARTVFEQAAVAASNPEPYAALQTDRGIRSILNSGLAYSPDVTYVAITDAQGFAIAHSSPALEGERLPTQALLGDLIRSGWWEQLRAVYSDRTFEVRERLLQGSDEFGSIRVGLSMLLVRQQLRSATRPVLVTLIAALVLATAISGLLAQRLLRPIHVLRAGLSRLGRGELDVTLDLPSDPEFGDLGRSFKAIGEELATTRSQLAGQSAQVASIVDRLEDAVGVVGPGGDVLFANRALQALWPVDGEGARRVGALPQAHPLRALLRRSLDEQRSDGPATIPLSRGDGPPVDYLVTATAITDESGAFIGVTLLARDMAYADEVESTVRYSQKLAALGRLLAGVAHEVKNPLNAMTIHLELLRAKLVALEQAMGEGSHGQVSAVAHHASVIEREIRRLDDVVQGFLRFSRPDELDLATVRVGDLLTDVRRVIEPEWAPQGIRVTVDCPRDVPSVRADRGMLQQALLNLALNACQAMPRGGTLALQARAHGDRMVEVRVADTGVGIPPEHLEKIFNLYFTTKNDGSGIGLSMVYRTLQLLNGSIEVESTVGRGTVMRLLLPRA